MYRWMDRQIGICTDICIDILTNVQMDGYMYRWIDRQIDIHTDRWTDRLTLLIH